jgi:hypothetical protein
MTRRACMIQRIALQTDGTCVDFLATRCTHLPVLGPKTNCRQNCSALAVVGNIVKCGDLLQNVGCPRLSERNVRRFRNKCAVARTRSRARWHAKHDTREKDRDASSCKLATGVARARSRAHLCEKHDAVPAFLGRKEPGESNVKKALEKAACSFVNQRSVLDDRTAF